MKDNHNQRGNVDEPTEYLKHNEKEYKQIVESNAESGIWVQFLILLKPELAEE